MGQEGQPALLLVQPRPGGSLWRTRDRYDGESYLAGTDGEPLWTCPITHGRATGRPTNPAKLTHLCTLALGLCSSRTVIANYYNKTLPFSRFNTSGGPKLSISVHSVIPLVGSVGAVARALRSHSCIPIEGLSGSLHSRRDAQGSLPIC